MQKNNDLLVVKELLRRFGIIIYTGSRLDDLVMIELELDDLYTAKLIEKEEYFQAKQVILQELKKERREEI